MGGVKVKHCSRSAVAIEKRQKDECGEKGGWKEAGR